MQFEDWMTEHIKHIKDCNGRPVDFRPNVYQEDFIKNDLQSYTVLPRRGGMTTIRLMYALYSAILWDWYCVIVCYNSDYIEYMQTMLKNLMELNGMNDLVEVINGNRIFFNNGGKIIMYSASSNALKDKRHDVVIVDGVDDEEILWQIEN